MGVMSDYASNFNYDPVAVDRIVHAVNWTAFMYLDSSRNFSSWDSCVHDCAASAIKLSWYGQSSECLPNEDRQHRNENQQTYSTCQCDSRAQAWLNSIQTLHGFAFSGAAFLISLQVFVALLWDHEEMIARPKCSCPRDLSGQRNNG